MSAHLPRPVDSSELLKIFETLGIKLAVDPAQAGKKEDLVLNLSHGLVGAAEQHAMRAEQAARVISGRGEA